MNRRAADAGAGQQLRKAKASRERKRDIQADETGTVVAAKQAASAEKRTGSAAEHATELGAQPLQTPQACANPDTEDKRHQVLKRILAAHETWFDVQRDYEYAGFSFPGYAEFHSHGEQYVLVKRAKLWEVDTHEYLFFVLEDLLDAKQAQAWIDFVCTKGLEKVDPVPNHMSSAVTLVVLCNRCTPEAAKLFRSTRKRKNYMLGVRGWADVRLAIVQVDVEALKPIITNGAAKPMRVTLEANAQLAKAQPDNAQLDKAQPAKAQPVDAQPAQKEKAK